MNTKTGNTNTGNTNTGNTNTGWQAPLTLGCVLLGLLVTMQFRTQKNEGFPLAQYRPNDLVRMVRDSEAERDRLQDEVAQLRTRLQRFETAAAQEKGMAAVLSRELEERKMAAGLLPVEGPGVVILLRDSPRRAKPGEDAYFYIVHDVDLQQLMTELWAAGAEAISVNGQRMVASTAVRCVGPTILVNSTRLAPPYQVRVIGEPDTLAASLKMRGGFLDAMAVSIKNGVSVEIVRKAAVRVPAYEGTLTFKYGRPASEKNDSAGSSSRGPIGRRHE